MPNMANITVKKNDGTTDIVYTAKVPSAGDKTPAVWRSDSVGTAVSHRPVLQVSSQWNGTKTARRVNWDFVYPTTAVGSDGKINVVDKTLFSGTALVPSSVLDADVNEAVSQFANLFASALIKDSVKTGYAPT